MKTIGMIGGMSWESTAEYYKTINEQVRRQLGGLHSARLLLYSMDFAQLAELQDTGNWSACESLLTEAALYLEQAGADFLLLCSNTPHKVAPQLQARLSVPLLHIAEVAAEALQEKQIRTVALLGTRYTMQEAFYRDTLAQAGIRTIIPEEKDILIIDRVIFQELCVGVVSEKSKAALSAIIQKLVKQGAEGVLLACTELGMLLNEEDAAVPLFDTAYLHAKKAALLALA